MKKWMTAFLALSLILSISSGCAPKEGATGPLPSEAQAKVRSALSEKRSNNELETYELYAAARKDMALLEIETIRTTGLEREEQYKYAELLTWAEKREEAIAEYGELATGSDLTAREASKQLFDLNIPEVKEDPEGYEKMLVDYRTKFPPSPEDSFGLYSPVAVLSRYYNENNDPDSAIRIVMDEIEYLNTDAPYFSFRLLSARYQSYLDLGRKAEIIKLLNEHRQTFEDVAAERQKNVPADAEAAKEYERTTKSYESLAKAMQSGLARIKITNAEAPDFTFTHFFNTDPVDLKGLRGQVVMIDFWATWCGPCIGTFPELREIHAEYKDKGLFVLGVTGFQGSMSNHGKDRVTELSEEEELALMPEFIEHQDMTWPLAFSDRSCFDIEYGITGIPTSVIIDKQGIVRLFTHPANKDQIIALIEELLAE